MRDSEGVQVYRRAVPGNSFEMVRGTTVVPQPVGRVLPVLVDLEGLPAWVPNLVETRLVEPRGPTERLESWRMHLPLGMRREFHLRSTIAYDPHANRVEFRTTSAEDPAFPEPSATLGTVYLARFSVWPVDGQRTGVEFQIHVNPRSGLFAFLVSRYQIGSAERTLHALRARVAGGTALTDPPAMLIFDGREKDVGPWFTSRALKRDVHAGSRIEQVLGGDSPGSQLNERSG